MEVTTANGLVIKLDTLENQRDLLGNEFRASGIFQVKNTEKWINKMLCSEYIYSFRYINSFKFLYLHVSQDLKIINIKIKDLIEN